MAKSVLVVDDDKWFSDHVARTLQRDGFTTVTAQDGLEGMEAINNHMPQVIFLDIFMRGPNGLVLMHELQSHRDLAAIPIVICTNSGAELSPRELAPYGVVRVLDKATMHPADILAAAKGAL